MFLRIDDRFIHGQVGVTWVSYVGCSEIVLCNDELAKNELASMMQKMTVPTMKVTIKTVEEGIEYLKGKKPASLAKLFVIVSCPQDAIKLMDGGLIIESINIGHTAHKDNSTEVHSCLFVDEDSLKGFQEIEKRGIKLDFRLVPSHKAPNLDFSKMTLK